jgi:alanine racemase
MPERFDEVVRHGFRQVVYDEQSAALLARAARRAGTRAPVHLKVETGTNRLGVRPHAFPDLAAYVRSEPALLLEGAYTHYANVEDTIDNSFAEHQLNRFIAALAPVEREAPVPIKHSAATAASILYPETYFNLVRVGIGLYGLWPSSELTPNQSTSSWMAVATGAMPCP